MKKSYWKILSGGDALYAILFICIPLIAMLCLSFKNGFDIAYFSTAIFFLLIQLAILVDVYIDYKKQK